jgi:hypothetical protein
MTILALSITSLGNVERKFLIYQNELTIDNDHVRIHYAEEDEHR